jgi:hypothetical protein
MEIKYEYTVRKQAKNIWEICKWEDYHWTIDKIYHVKKLSDRFYCDCPARFNCKHVKLVMQTPKKDFF